MGRTLEVQRLSNRGFGFAFTIIALIIVAIRWWSTGDVPRLGLGIAGGLFVVALVLPAVLLPLNRLWTQIASRLSVVTNTLLLGIAMYLLLFPVGVMMRLFRRELLDRSLSPDAESYLVTVTRQTNTDTLPDIF